MNSHDKEVQKIISQLDGIATQYEVKWGVGMLQKYCSPELQKKWLRQCEKFRDALLDDDVDKIRDIATGTNRAYEVLENDCLERGYNPVEAACYSFDYKGTEIIVCATQDDVCRITAKRKGNYNCKIWSMANVAELIAKEDLCHVLAEREKKTVKSDSVSKKPDVDFDEGDEIPW